jgi:type 1 glutamine amidotransferase
MFPPMKTNHSRTQWITKTIRTGLVALLAFLPAANPAAAAGAPRKILFLAGPHSHGPGEHEFPAGSLLLSDALNKSGVGAWAQTLAGWPANPQAAFAGISAVVLFCDGEGMHVAAGHWQALDSLNRGGVGIVLMHYALVVAKGNEGDNVQNWIGGYYETNWSVNPVWKAEFPAFPAHAAARGVRPFAMSDEWYFHMRFRAGMEGVTPLLSAHPPASTVMGQPDSPHGSNPGVRADVSAGVLQHMAWVAETPGRGRGFGFTGGHTHAHWGDADLLKLVMDGIWWTAGGEVPAEGVTAPAMTAEQVKAFLTAKIPAFASWGATSALSPAARALFPTAARAASAGARNPGAGFNLLGGAAPIGYAGPFFLPHSP